MFALEPTICKWMTPSLPTCVSFVPGRSIKGPVSSKCQVQFWVEMLSQNSLCSCFTKRYRMPHKSCVMCVCVLPLSCVRLFATPWTRAHRTPLSMGFPRQEHCGGLTCTSPGGLPDPRIEPWSPALQVVSLLCEPPRKPLLHCKLIKVKISSPRYSLSSRFAIELPLWDLIKKKNSSMLALKRCCQKVPGTDYVNLATFQLGSLSFAYLFFHGYDLSLYLCKCHSLLNDIEHLLHFIFLKFLNVWNCYHISFCVNGFD